MAEGHPPTLRRTTVVADGCTLAAWAGAASGPPILFVHGYPDTHHVWDGVIDRLQANFRCLTYDVRGAGESEAPDSQDGYHLSRLRHDLTEVIDTLSPQQPVHLVGHDWGSIQGWDVVIREQSGRIASFTSISGPCLQHVSAFAQATKHSGWGLRSGGWGRKWAAASQAARLWYVYAFQVPQVPDRVVPWLARRLLRAGGAQRRHLAPTLERDARNGLGLYRANFAHLDRIPGGPCTDLPVQLVIPLRDKYVRPVLVSHAASFASDLKRVEIDAGHWVMQTCPDEIATLVAEFALAHPAGAG